MGYHQLSQGSSTQRMHLCQCALYFASRVCAVTSTLPLHHEVFHALSASRLRLGDAFGPAAGMYPSDESQHDRPLCDCGWPTHTSTDVVLRGSVGRHLRQKHVGAGQCADAVGGWRRRSCVLLDTSSWSLRRSHRVACCHQAAAVARSGHEQEGHHTQRRSHTAQGSA